MTVQYANTLTPDEQGALGDLIVRVLDTDRGMFTYQLARLLVQPNYVMKLMVSQLRDAGRIVPSPNGWRLPADRTPIVR